MKDVRPKNAAPADIACTYYVLLAFAAVSVVCFASPASSAGERYDPGMRRLADTIVGKAWDFRSKAPAYGPPGQLDHAFPCLDQNITFGTQGEAELSCSAAIGQKASWRLSRSSMGDIVLELTQAGTSNVVSLVVRILRDKGKPVLEVLRTMGERPDEGNWFEFVERPSYPGKR